ncbi:MAG: ABC transporter substrate-binding protein [Pseudonocardiaceae bacterium]
MAAEVPAAAPDGRSWTVKLRQGVTFHDGSAFDAEDVVATYRAVLNPVFAATVSSDFPMLTGVEKVDASTVRFELAYPYAPFVNRLNLGIMPSEALAAPAPQESSPFNTAPVETRPYTLAEWRKGSTMTLDANETYFDGAPPVKKITIVFAEDDNTRAQQMRAGDLDATVLPPALARTFEGGEFAVLHHRSADYRTVTMPSSHPVTGDPAIRMALNLAVNRQGMIDALLTGKGVPG